MGNSIAGPAVVLEERPMEYRIASEKDIELLIQSRMDTLRDVNHLDAGYGVQRRIPERKPGIFPGRGPDNRPGDGG